MKKLLTLFLFFFFIFTCTFSSAGSVSLTTYYPAPFGNYDTLRLVPRSAPACDGSGSNRGIMYFDTTTDRFNVCGAVYDFVTGAKTLNWAMLEPLWGRDSGGDPYAIFPSPTITGINGSLIKVGIRTKTPQGILDVDGSTIAGAGVPGLPIYFRAQPSPDADGGSIYLLPGSCARGVSKDGAVVIGGATKVSKLTILNDGGIYASGTYDPVTPVGRTLGNLNAQTAMIWYPRKAAFRAGAVFDDTINPNGKTYWNDANIGNFSVAMGQNSIASGVGSVALGIGCSAGGGTISGLNVFGGNIAMGYDSHASSDTNDFGSVAIGSSAQSTADSAVALGYIATASGSAAVAIGSSSEASGTGSIAIGNATASGGESIAIGAAAIAGPLSGSYAFGTYTAASAYQSMAIGGFIQVNGDNSVGIGVGPAGAYPNTMNQTPTTANTFYVRGGNVDMQGGRVAIGNSVTASGTNSVAIGNNITVNASATNSVGIGVGSSGVTTPATANTFYVLGGQVLISAASASPVTGKVLTVNGTSYFSNNLAVNAGGLTVTAGGVAVTGNSTFSNNVTVSGRGAFNEVKLGNNTGTCANGTDVGVLRYKVSGTNATLEACMQRSLAPTYGWVVVFSSPMSGT